MNRAARTKRKAPFQLGGAAPKPPGFTAFFPPEWPVCLAQFGGGRGCRPGAFPAAEPVARVASQYGPIPSDSGAISMEQAGGADYVFAANGESVKLAVVSLSGPPHSCLRRRESSRRYSRIVHRLGFLKHSRRASRRISMRQPEGRATVRSPAYVSACGGRPTGCARY